MVITTVGAKAEISPMETCYVIHFKLLQVSYKPRGLIVNLQLLDLSVSVYKYGTVQYIKHCTAWFYSSRILFYLGWIIWEKANESPSLLTPLLLWLLTTQIFIFLTCVNWVKSLRQCSMKSTVHLCLCVVNHWGKSTVSHGSKTHFESGEWSFRGCKWREFPLTMHA